MREFGKEARDYFAFRFDGEEEEYKIPLASSMTNRQAKAFREVEGDYFLQVEWLREFIGDAVDDLTVEDTSKILSAWVQASTDSGASVGESSASSE